MNYAFIYRWGVSSVARKLNENNIMNCRDIAWRAGKQCKRTFSATARSCGLQSWRVATFDCSKMEEKGQKIVHLSNKSHASWVTGTRFRPRFSCHLLYGIDYQPAKEVNKKIPFPKDTQGFFYYFRDIAMPRVSGGIRFRVCKDLNDFGSGYDLPSPVGEPWAIPLIYLVRDKKWLHTLEQLVADGLVEEELVRDIKKLRMARKSIGYRPLFMPTEPFYFDLRHRLLAFHLITRKSSDRVLFQHIFYSSGVKQHQGRVKLRFEMAEDTAEPTLVLRILALLDPIQYPVPLPDESVILKAGDLLQRRSSKGVIKPWTYDLNTRSNGVPWQRFMKACGRW